ncbi:AAA domain-containing protein [Photobacterium carnosum]|uniref:McrB family protein n=1 Tax=Photobacterium carnosum TaxID=2023717 RepID=UPI001E28D311|nr:AAA domain-containing protein [Photobacterium carnosum]
MYLSRELVVKAYGQLVDIDDTAGKSRMEKVSGIRYLLATSELLKKHNLLSLDLCVDNRELRKEFVDAVAEVICIDSEKNYTKDFFTDIGKHKDFGVGSNFFTTRLANSRAQEINYPGRPSSLLKLNQENISILGDACSKLTTDYSLITIKTPLSIWILRNTNFNIEISISEPAEILELIKQKLIHKYTQEVADYLTPNLVELSSIIGSLSEPLFETEQSILTSLLVKNIEVPTEDNYIDSSEANPHVMKNDLSDDDEILLIVKKLLERGSKGILFSGPPGTGKTWYALKIALKLIDGNINRLDRVQFHPSYSYEDFIEGMVSTGSISGSEPLFKAKDKTFVNLCNVAKEDKDNAYFLIIDEFTRGDPSKIFGELLTYIEADYRDLKFILPYSEKEFSVPHNIILFATMNPYDKSVVDLDAAMERRFDVIELPPNVNTLTYFLSNNGIKKEIVGKVITFFNRLNSLSDHGFGHTYFKNMKEEEDFILLWNHKLRFQLEEMFRFKENAYKEVRDLYLEILSEQGKDKLQ